MTGRRVGIVAAAVLCGWLLAVGAVYAALCAGWFDATS